MLAGITLVSFIGFGAALLSLAVAGYVWRHRRERVAIPLIGLLVTLSLWSAVYSIQLGFGTLAEQLVWQRVTLGIAGFVPAAWFVFVLAYVDDRQWRTRNRLLVLFLEPVAFLAVTLTNPGHELVWTDATLRATAIGTWPALEFGIGYVAHIAFAYALVGVGIGMLLLYGTSVAPTYQRQVLVLVTAATPPFLAHVLFTFGASPVPGLDLTPFMFAFTGVVFGLGLFRFDLVHLAPIARDQSFEEIGDGLVLIDASGTIVDLFGVAPAVIDPTPAVGDRIERIFPDRDPRELDGTELRPTGNGGHIYQIQVSSLADHHDEAVGTILMLRDITAFWESNQRLSVSNRVLRHNLRNDMTVVLGVAEQLAVRLDGEDAEDARRITDTADHLVEIAEKTRRITELPFDAERNGGTIDAVTHLEELVADTRADYPSAEVQVTLPSAHTLTGIEPEPFRLAIRNVLENAIEHNDGGIPTVDLTLERTDVETRIHLADDGPGIPDIEQEVIGAEAETPLEHSGGVGLWLTHWCVSMWDGELRLDSGADGTTVTITVPGNGAET